MFVNLKAKEECWDYQNMNFSLDFGTIEYVDKNIQKGRLLEEELLYWLSLKLVKAHILSCYFIESSILMFAHALEPKVLGLFEKKPNNIF